MHNPPDKHIREAPEFTFTSSREAYYKLRSQTYGGRNSRNGRHLHLLFLEKLRPWAWHFAFWDYIFLSIYGSEFWTMYNWPFSDLEHFYYTWFAPSYSETISFGVVVKSTNRAFRKHILYIPLLIFVHHTGLQMQKNDKKWCFYTFSFFRNRPVNFQATLLILSNYSVNVVCLGPVS